MRRKSFTTTVSVVTLCLSACINRQVAVSNPNSSGLIAVLHTDAPAADRAAVLALYGQFVGDWDAEIATYSPTGERNQGQGEIHFGWILEGRAIQDVWMIPRQKDRRPEPQSGFRPASWRPLQLRTADTSDTAD
jgi:hypothetical protein